MTSLGRGRPTISESELTPAIKIALAHRVKGKTWKECAKSAGIAYSTLRDWIRDNKEARNFLKEKVEDHLDQSYFYLAQCLGDHQVGVFPQTVLALWVSGGP